MRKFFSFLAALLGIPVAYAHCPLCTVGAASLAVGATWLGVPGAIIGIFIGAFSIALGLWLGRKIKRFVPYQPEIAAIIMFASIVLPILPLVQDYTSFELFLTGSYGSMLNKTYLLNRFLLGSLGGAAIMFASPFFSRSISKIRGTTLPYQGISLTFVLLIIAALIAGASYA